VNWSPTHKNSNYWVIKRKANKEKYRSSLRALKDWIKSSWSMPLKMIVSSLRKKLQGYWNYYGVIANSEMIWRYWRAVEQ